MSEIQLGYGKGHLAFEYRESRFQLLVPENDVSEPLSDLKINNAIDAPIGSPHIGDLIGQDSRVLIVVSDATRATASAQIVNLLVRRIIATGVAPSDIAIIFATGIHRATTEDEKRELLTPFVFQRIKSFDHDAYDESGIVGLGLTNRGVPIEINRNLREYSHVFLTGGVGYHYFAGFTGGRKSICPGLTSAETVKSTHMLALDFETGGRRAGVAAGRLDGNAVNEECERVAAEVNPSFLINTIVDDAGRAVGVFAGHWKEAHRKACEVYSAGHSVRLEKKRNLVIASCGGMPYDVNLIQAHKTLDMAALACNPGGTIVLLAECSDGFGRQDFLKWFSSKDSRDLEDRLRTGYEVNGQTAWALLTKAEQFNVYLISNLPDDAVSMMRMKPARTIGEAIENVGSEVDGYIMPRGASLLPVTVE